METTDNGLCLSLLGLLGCLLQPFVGGGDDGRGDGLPVQTFKPADLQRHLDQLFLFALTWFVRSIVLRRPEIGPMQEMRETCEINAWNMRGKCEINAK